MITLFYLVQYKIPVGVVIFNIFIIFCWFWNWNCFWFWIGCWIFFLSEKHIY